MYSDRYDEDRNNCLYLNDYKDRTVQFCIDVEIRKLYSVFDNCY